MSFKKNSPTLPKVTTYPKAPTDKHTVSAEHLADQITNHDILTNHSVEKHLAEVNFDDHGHSILKESGLTRGHSILETSFGDKLSSSDSILGGAGKHKEPQFGEEGLRSAVGFAKGMAGKGGSDSGSGQEMTFTPEEGAALNAGYEAGYEEGKNDSGVDAYTEGYQDGLARGETSDNAEQSNQSTPEDANNELWVDTACGVGLVAVSPSVIGGIAIVGICATYKLGKTEKWWRPGPDDNGGSEGGFMTWKLQDQLSNGLQDVKDPITNPYDENQGGGVLTASDLEKMESDLRKDPATNWGDDTYVNFVGSIEMNVFEIALNDPSINWGDNSTTTDKVIDTIFTPDQNVF
ncbi:hypothetical protein ACLM44_12545 [Synechococcus sp. W2B2]|uniref:hypothetical protein n=1 Tax=unclassified Synechococcus TaxID=2626047 RepID=UPI00006BB388|nr:hypothetical protein [Synechococcus sp. WH 7805]EAR19886.1 hypothetical protein WH7805_13238 [Synechococcus sp. WH 7805]